MKAVLVNKELLTILAEDLEQAYALAAKLREEHPNDKWTVMAPPISVHEGPMYAQYDALEHLYALAGILLQQSGLNPFGLALQVAQLDGTVKDVTAVTIMREGRHLIDDLHKAVH